MTSLEVARAFLQRFECAMSIHRSGHKIDPDCEIATNEDMLEAIELIEDLTAELARCAAYSE